MLRAKDPNHEQTKPVHLDTPGLTIAIIHFVVEIDKCVFAFPVDRHFQKQKILS